MPNPDVPSPEEEGVEDPRPTGSTIAVFQLNDSGVKGIIPRNRDSYQEIVDKYPENKGSAEQADANLKTLEDWQERNGVDEVRDWMQEHGLTKEILESLKLSEEESAAITAEWKRLEEVTKSFKWVSIYTDPHTLFPQLVVKTNDEDEHNKVLADFVEEMDECNEDTPLLFSNRRNFSEEEINAHLQRIRNKAPIS